LAVALTAGLHAQDSVAAHFQAGRQALQSGAFEQAADEFQKVLKADPGLLEARVNLGLAQHLLGRYAESTATLEPVPKQKPSLVPAQLFLGIGYLKLGQPKKAIPYLEQTIRLDAANREAHAALAACEAEAGDYGAAAREYRAIFGLEKDQSEAWFQLGRGYSELASRVVRRMSLEHRRSVWGHRLAADLYGLSGRWEMAAEELREALALDAQAPGLHQALGEVYRQLGKPTEADEEFRAAGASKSSPDESAFERQDWERSSVSFASSLLAASQRADLLYYLSRSYQHLADECFRNMQEVAPDSWRAHQMKAEAFAVRYKDAEAVAEYERAAQLQPSAPEIWEELGALYQQIGREDEARAAVEKALALEPGRPRALYLMGVLAGVQGIPYLEKALKYDGNLLEARAALGRAYLDEGKFALAAPQLEKALPLDRHGDIHFQLSRAYKAMGKPQQAQVMLAKSAEIRRNTVERDREKLERWSKQ
jgi:tetratricopeptide (TPR) repeat protein